MQAKRYAGHVFVPPELKVPAGGGTRGSQAESRLQDSGCYRGRPLADIRRHAFVTRIRVVSLVLVHLHLPYLRAQSTPIPLIVKI